MVTSPGGQVGQPHGGLPGQCLDHRDVSLGEGRVVGAAADRQHAQRARTGHEGGDQHAPGVYPGHDVPQRGDVLEVRGHVGGGVPDQPGGPAGERGPDRPLPDRGDRLAAQVGELDPAVRPAVGDRDGLQRAVRAGQEDQAEVGQAVHHQLGGVLEQLVPVLRRGDHVAGLQQEGDPLLGAGRLSPGGPFPGLQQRPLLLGALPGGQVDHVGHPA